MDEVSTSTPSSTSPRRLPLLLAQLPAIRQRRLTVPRLEDHVGVEIVHHVPCHALDHDGARAPVARAAVDVLPIRPVRDLDHLPLAFGRHDPRHGITSPNTTVNAITRPPLIVAYTGYTPSP